MGLENCKHWGSSKVKRKKRLRWEKISHNNFWFAEPLGQDFLVWLNKQKDLLNSWVLILTSYSMWWTLAFPMSFPTTNKLWFEIVWNPLYTIYPVRQQMFLLPPLWLSYILDILIPRISYNISCILIFWILWTIQACSESETCQMCQITLVLPASPGSYSCNFQVNKSLVFPPSTTSLQIRTAFFFFFNRPIEINRRTRKQCMFCERKNAVF